MHKKALTPVLSMVLLLMIAVASIGIIYSFYMKLQKGTQSNIQKQTGAMQQKIQQQMNTNFNVESSFITTDGYIGLSIRNTGNSQLCLNQLTFYLNGQIIPQNKIKQIYPKSSECVNPGQIMSLNLTSYDYPVEGHSYNLKITTESRFTTTYTITGKKVDIDKGLVLFYNFDSGNPKTVFDRSGNDNNGIIYGNPSYVDGVEGKALDFDGVDDYVQMQDSHSLFVGNTISIFAWVDRENSNDPGDVIYSDIAWPRVEYSLELHRTSTFFYSNKGTPKGIVFTTSSNCSVFAHKWTFVGVVWNGTVVKFYKNGLLIDTKLFEYRPVEENNLPHRVARRTGGWGPFHGAIDDVRVYDYPITNRQIKYLFCQGAYNLQQKGEFDMPSWCKEYLPD